MIILSGTWHPCVPYIGTFHRIKQVPKSIKSQFYVVEPFAGLSICPNQWKSNFIVEPFAGLSICPNQWKSNFVVEPFAGLSICPNGFSICPNQWKVKTQFYRMVQFKAKNGSLSNSLVCQFTNIDARLFWKWTFRVNFFVCSVPPVAMTEGKFREILEPQLIPHRFSQLSNVVDYE